MTQLFVCSHCKRLQLTTLLPQTQRTRPASDVDTVAPRFLIEAVQEPASAVPLGGIGEALDDHRGAFGERQVHGA